MYKLVQMIENLWERLDIAFYKDLENHIQHKNLPFVNDLQTSPLHKIAKLWSSRQYHATKLPYNLYYVTKRKWF